MNENVKTTLYAEIFSQLQDAIRKGSIAEGEQIPTEKQLTVQYEISRITASRAVKELEALGYVTRMKAKGTFVNPRSRWKENYGGGVSDTQPFVSILFPAPVASMSLNMELLHGVESACRSIGYNLTVASINAEDTDSKRPLDIEKQLISNVIESGARGAVIYPYSTHSSPEVYNRLILHSFPFVLLDRMVFGIDATGVCSDNKKGYYQVVEHLVLNGHKRIAFVSGNTYESINRSDRFAGYLQAMNQFRLEIDDRWIYHNLIPFDYNKVFLDQKITGNDILRSEIRRMLEELLRLPDPPTAITATNDYIALNILNVARDMGIGIPEQISVTGFDNLEVCSLFSPRLTTVSQPFRSMGSTAVKLLDGLIKNPDRKPEQLHLPTEIVTGESVRRLG